MNFAQKLKAKCDELGWKPARVVAEFEGDEGAGRAVVYKWFNDEAVPNIKHGLKLARLIGLPLEYLADDTSSETPGNQLKASEPGEDEAFVLRVFRSLGISPEEAVRRMAGEPATKVAAGPAQVVASRDESEHARRDEKRRLGFELDTDMDGANREDDPSLRRRRR